MMTRMTPLPGEVVRILPPFAEVFPGTYGVVEVITHPDGQIACVLEPDIGAFDPKYLEILPEGES